MGKRLFNHIATLSSGSKALSTNDLSASGYFNRTGASCLRFTK